MKKIIAVTLALLMLLGVVACGQTAPAETTAPEQTATEQTAETAALQTVNPGKLTMSTNATFPPYEMVAGDGSYEGIDVEIAQAIAAKLGLELQIDDMEFDAALKAAQDGKSDIVMAAVTVNDERLLVMDFSNSYANGVQVVIVKEGSDVTLDNMGEKLIGTQAGTTGYMYCLDFGDEHVIAFDNGATAVQALVNGQVDCVVIDNAPAQEFVKANAGLTILDSEFTNENYAIGMAKGNTELLNAINSALAELTADGTVEKIISKYISA